MFIEFDWRLTTWHYFYVLPFIFTLHLNNKAIPRTWIPWGMLKLNATHWWYQPNQPLFTFFLVSYLYTCTHYDFCVSFPSVQLQGNISGGNYPPPQFAVYMMNVISAIHMITIAFFFLGDQVWTMLGLTSPPSWYNTCKQYPMQTLVFIFLILPSFGTKFVTTGAFEISCNGDVLFSKLESGRFPNANDLISAFKDFGLTHHTH